MKRIALVVAFVAMTAAGCSPRDRGTSDTTQVDSMADSTHEMTDSMKAMPDTTKRP
jgi:hypothetical protein